MDYNKFLASKIKNHIKSGFTVSVLFPFQGFIVLRALEAGKYAVFADCGLGKSIIQLEWAYQVWKYTHQPVLILAPLAVSGQTIQEGNKFGIEVFKYTQTENPMTTGYGGIWISNYEQLDNINCEIFSGVVLDESSILKNFTGVIKNKIIDKFKNTKYKLCCTATPSPNDPMELGNHSEFIDVMPYNEMLAMYFYHDGGETSKWQLKGHAVDDFYKWVGTWAIMLNNPCDIGFEQDGFDLPPINFIEKKIITIQGYRQGREDEDEKHICPLQIDTIDRLIYLYSNIGDTVLSPFAGIGSEVYQAVKRNRYGMGIELKESYFELMKKNLESLLREKLQEKLF